MHRVNTVAIFKGWNTLSTRNCQNLFCILPEKWFTLKRKNLLRLGVIFPFRVDVREANSFG